MLRIRPYKNVDAKKIVLWCKDEITFRRWTFDRYESFPITPEDMNRKYNEKNGDCVDSDNFYPMTAFDETEVIGHFIMRFTDEKKTVVRFGYVIVDDSKRGKGYGKEMISLALKYAFEILKVCKATIGVVSNNESAYRCYKSVGFQEANTENTSFYVQGKKWDVTELEITKEKYFNLYK